MSVIPAGSTYARFALFDAGRERRARTSTSCVYLAAQHGRLAAAAGTSAEEVNLLESGGRRIHACVSVQGWGVGGPSPFKLHSWLVSVRPLPAT